MLWWIILAVILIIILFISRKDEKKAISANSVRPNINIPMPTSKPAVSDKIWDDSIPQVEAWPLELTREDLAVKPIIFPKSPGFRKNK